MSEHSERLSEVMFFAGPNGSGKSTITGMAKIVGQYINADDIKRASLCTDLEAAQKAEQLRREMLNGGRDFTFETVLSTDRNLKLLQEAKARGYFVRGIYVLTADPNINIARVNARVALGGQGVPKEKIRRRYDKALALLCRCRGLRYSHIYDNTKEPFRIFKKRKDQFFHWENAYWKFSDIEKLTGISF